MPQPDHVVENEPIPVVCLERASVYKPKRGVEVTWDLDAKSQGMLYLKASWCVGCTAEVGWLVEKVQ